MPTTHQTASLPKLGRAAAPPGCPGSTALLWATLAASYSLMLYLLSQVQHTGAVLVFTLSMQWINHFCLFVKDVYQICPLLPPYGAQPALEPSHVNLSPRYAI